MPLLSSIEGEKLQKQKQKKEEKGLGLLDLASPEPAMSSTSWGTPGIGGLLVGSVVVVACRCSSGARAGGFWPWTGGCRGWHALVDFQDLGENLTRFRRAGGGGVAAPSTFLEASSKILSVRATWVERPTLVLLPAMLASVDVKALREGIARAHLQPSLSALAGVAPSAMPACASCSSSLWSD
jgi:hypothetical protein